MKMPKFCTKNALFGLIGAKVFFKKNCCHICNQHPKSCLIVRFGKKIKRPKFGTKNAFLGYFWPKTTCLGIFELEFENNIAVFEICVLEFVLLQSLVQNYKSLKVGPKIGESGIFRLELESNIVIFEINTLHSV